MFRKYIQDLKPDIGAHTYTQSFRNLTEAMDTAVRYARGQEMLRGNINYVEEIEELKYQINMLKLGIGQPEIIQPSARSLSPLNRPYESRMNEYKQPIRDPVKCWNCDDLGHFS